MNLKNNKVKTLIVFSIVIIVVLLLLTIVLNFALVKFGIIKIQTVSEETQKQEAQDKINSKIKNVKIECYIKNNKLPGLQYLADKLCEDNDIEYVRVKKKETASSERIILGEAETIATKLENYPYEFEINRKLQLTSTSRNLNENTNSNDTTGTYYIMSSDNGISNVSIVLQNETGFKEITYPENEMTLNMNNRNKVGIDYQISEEKDYYFRIKNEKGTKDIELNKNSCITVDEVMNETYPIATRYGIENGKIVSLSSEYEGTIKYSLDGRKTWQEYDKPIVIPDTTTIYAKIEVANMITKIEEKQIVLNYASDALPPECCDGNNSTEKSLTYGNYKLYIDEEVYGAPLIFNGYTTNWYQGWAEKRAKLDFYLKDGTTVNLFDVNTPTTWTDYVITIPQDAEYLQFTANDSYALNILDIRLDRGPKYVESKQYTKVTSEGFEDPYTNVTINYFKSDDIRLYKIGNGSWEIYEDIPVRTEIGDILYAKGIDKNGIENTSQLTVNYATDTLPKECYDNNLNTEKSLTYGNYKLYISEEMYGEILLLNGYTTNVYQGYDNRRAKLDFYLKDGTTTNIIDVNRPTTWTDYNITIPQNAEYLQITANDSYAFNIKDITIDKAPKYVESKQYTKLTSAGFENPYTNVTINYFQADITRLYKIGNGDWKEYENVPIRTEIGEILYAKGIGRDGKEHTSQLTINYAADTLPKECYDNNLNTEKSLTYGNYKLYISEEMYGKTLLLNGYTTNWYQGWAEKRAKLDFYLNDGSTTSIINTNTPTTWTDYNITIPQNTRYLQFTATDSYAFNIKDLRVK